MAFNEFGRAADEYGEYLDPRMADPDAVIDGDEESSILYGVGADVPDPSLHAARKKFSHFLADRYFKDQSGRFYEGEAFASRYRSFIRDLTSPKFLADITKLYGSSPSAPFMLWCDIFCSKFPAIPRKLTLMMPELNFHILHIQSCRERMSRLFSGISTRRRAPSSGDAEAQRASAMRREGDRARAQPSGVGSVLTAQQEALEVDHYPLLPGSTVSMNNRYPLPPK